MIVPAWSSAVVVRMPVIAPNWPAPKEADPLASHGVDDQPWIVVPQMPLEQALVHPPRPVSDPASVGAAPSVAGGPPSGTGPSERGMASSAAESAGPASFAQTVPQATS